MDSGPTRAFHLGRYNCIERLGEGPIGVTWRAKVYGVAGFEKQFAVTRLHRRLSQDEAFVSGFVRAARAHSGLDHECIARVHEVNVQGAQHYVASDLIRGIDLEKLMEAIGQRDKVLSRDAALLIALEVTDALGHAHERRDLLPEGVIHLGFTPRSVMITHEGEIRLLDVGLMAPLIRPGWASGIQLASTTRYLAPEVLRADRCDARADVFSLGVVLHELIGGIPPFAGGSVEELLARMKTPPVVPPCDPRLQAALGRALQPNAELRLQSMAEWREQLEPILASRANRARSDLAAAVRGVARPERRTGAFPWVAVPALPPPSPPGNPPSRRGWARSVEQVICRTPTMPRGQKLSSSPIHDTLSGVGADDAAVLPLELVELPGTPTLPTIDAVPPDRGEAASDAGSTQPGLERIDLEMPTVTVTVAQAAPANVAAEPDTSSFEKPGSDAVNGAGPYRESQATANTENPFAQTPLGQAIPADPARFPSLAAEDARDRRESRVRAQTMPSTMPPGAVVSGTATDTFAEAAMAAAAGSAALTHEVGTQTVTGSPSRGGPPVPEPSKLLRSTGVDGVVDEAATDRRGVATSERNASSVASAERDAATARDGTNGGKDTTRRGLNQRDATSSGRNPAVTPRDGAAGDAIAQDGVMRPAGSAGPFIRPPPGLPPVPEERRWLLLVGVAALAAVSIAGAVFFVYWKVGSAPPNAEQGVAAGNRAPRAAPTDTMPQQDPTSAPPLMPTGAPSTGIRAGAAPTGFAAEVAPLTPATAANPSGPASGAPMPSVSASSVTLATPPVALPSTSASSAPAGSVDVATTPAGASIYVDGELRGDAPVRLQLTPGAHRVVALLEGARLRRESVRVAQGLTQVNLTMDLAALPTEVAGEAGLKVRCAKTHGELRILIDGQDTGRQCPNQSRIAVKPGWHRIGLYSPRTDQTVEVEKDIGVGGDHSMRVYLRY